MFATSGTLILSIHIQLEYNNSLSDPSLFVDVGKYQTSAYMALKVVPQLINNVNLPTLVMNTETARNKLNYS